MDTNNEEGSVTTESSENVVKQEESVVLSPVSTSKRRFGDNKKKTILWSGAGLVAVMLVVALLTGLMTVIFKLPSQKVVVFPGVCGSAAIDEYNTIMTNAIAETSEQTIPKLDNLVSDFQQNSAYDGDSNCLYISFRVAYIKKDVSAAQGFFDKLKAKVEGGQPIDGRLQGIASISNMEEGLVSITPNQEDGVDD